MQEMSFHFRYIFQFNNQFSRCEFFLKQNNKSYTFVSVECVRYIIKMMKEIYLNLLVFYLLSLDH